MPHPRLYTFSKAPGHKRRRIILLFAMGIVLPSVLLGYLAFRGVQNDRALLEKQRLDESREIAGLVVREIDESITAVETAFAATVAAAGAGKAGAAEVMNALDEFATGHPLVEQTFCLRDFAIVHFPPARLLYLADGSPQAGSAEPRSGPHPSSADIRNAQDLEFRRKNFPQALAFYLRILEQTSDLQLEGEILNAVARVQKKSGLLREAAATYERIARDHSAAVISDGIPLGAAARLELGSLYRELDEPEKSREILIGLYKSLLRSEWPVRRAEFDFFLERAKSILRELLSAAPPGLDLKAVRDDLGSLGDEEKEGRQWTERMIAFEEGAASGLEAKVGIPVSESRSSPVRVILDVGRHSYLVSLRRQAFPDRDRPEETWGIILDSGRLRDSVLRPALLRRVSSRETSWIVKGRDGRTLLASDPAPTGTAAVRADFVSNFPDWTLEFHLTPPDLIKTFLASRRGVYSSMFLLIAGILLFGLILTVRTVSRELELARMKSDFVSTISHEFKSPLTSIRQLAEMLHSGRVPSEDRRRKYYDVLLEQSERLSLLTDNILNLARIEEGHEEFRFEAADLGGLVREIAASVQDRMRHEGFEIDVEAGEAGLEADIDRDAVSQALANLLDNAVKYSGESRKVLIRLFRENREAVVAVRDFGIGIRKSELDKVFDRFFRGGDELTRTVKGTGLGLSLVKEIVEAHRGRVLVESEPGKGSTFSIRLPLRRPEEA